MRNRRMRNGMLGAMAMAALLLGGCAQGQGKMAYIGADAAKKQILAEVGLDESQVKINSVDMATRNGMDYYRVEFSDENGNVYRYDIEALTGKVIESAAVEDTAGETAAQTTAAGSGAGETAAQANAGAAASAGAQTASSQTVGSGTAGSGTGITAEKAKEKALAHAGLTADQVTFTKAKADRDDGRSLYEIDFYGNDGTEYEYEIDATSGDVIKYDVEAPKLQVAGQQAGGGAAASAGAQTAGSQTVGSGTAGNGTGITEEEAKEKALAHAGLTAAQVTFTKAKADRDDGRSLYEIDFYENDGTEYEYEIDATSGDVIKYDMETPRLQAAGQQAGASANLQAAGQQAGAGANLQAAGQQAGATPSLQAAGQQTGGQQTAGQQAGSTTPNLQISGQPDAAAESYLSADEAKRLALAQVPGASAGDIVEFETDRDDGRIEYEGKILYGGMEYEFEIDGYSGAFRKWECEYDDDHHDGHHD